MSKIKLIGVPVMVLAAGTFSSAVKAQQTVDLYAGPYAPYSTPAQSSPYQYGVGGEFTAVVTSGDNYLSHYATSATATFNALSGPGTVTGFETFCVQTGVYFTPYNWGNPNPDNFSLSSASIGNSVDGNASGNNPQDNYALSVGAAWLYANFATASLANYDFGTDAARNTDAGLLQEAIWSLQGNQSYNGYPSGVGNIYYNEAVTEAGILGVSATDAANSSDNFDVEIMNLYSGSGGPTVTDAAQNQLVYLGSPLTPTPHSNVPDGGTTSSLMALSLAGLAAFARKLGFGRSV